MKLFDRYLDKWISRKALAILQHKLAMCGYKTQITEKSTYYDIKVQKYHSEKKPVYFMTLNIIDGLEFYGKWYNVDFETICECAENCFKKVDS